MNCGCTSEYRCSVCRHCYRCRHKYIYRKDQDIWWVKCPTGKSRQAFQDLKAIDLVKLEQAAIKILGPEAIKALG